MRPAATALAAALLWLATSTYASAGKPIYTVIYTDKPGSGHSSAVGSLLSRNGVLYGVTYTSVFRLVPPASGHGAWTYDVIHGFTDLVGFVEVKAPLIADRAGALYGVVGSYFSDGGGDFAFKLTPPTSRNAPWKYEILYALVPSEGNVASNGVALGPAGELYGTASYGGRYNKGTLFLISPPTSQGASWKLTVLHDFREADGFDPSEPPTVHVDHGNVSLFGTTTEGGAHGEGVAYELVPLSGSQTTWTYTPIHSFDPGTGQPKGRLLVRNDLTVIGGTDVTSYALTPPGGGKPGWSLSILHDFLGKADDSYPYGSLFESPSATLYGAAIEYGSRFGIVFALVPRAGVKPRTLNVLYPFSPEDGDPEGSLANGLTADGTLALYGITNADRYQRIYQLTFAP